MRLFFSFSLFFILAGYLRFYGSGVTGYQTIACVRKTI